MDIFSLILLSLQPDLVNLIIWQLTLLILVDQIVKAYNIKDLHQQVAKIIVIRILNHDENDLFLYVNIKQMTKYFLKGL